MRSPPPAELRRVALFGAVGVANTLLSLAVFTALVALHVVYLVAAPLAFAVGALNGYLLNARFTFRQRRTRRALARYVAMQIAAAGVSDALLWVLVTATGAQLAAYALTLAAVSTATFLASRGWVFAAAR